MKLKEQINMARVVFKYTLSSSSTYVIQADVGVASLQADIIVEYHLPSQLCAFYIVDYSPGITVSQTPGNEFG